MSGVSMTVVSFILRFPTVTIGEAGAGQGIRGRSRSLQRTSRAAPRAKFFELRRSGDHSPQINAAGMLLGFFQYVQGVHGVLGTLRAFACTLRLGKKFSLLVSLACQGNMLQRAGQPGLTIFL